MAIESVGNIFGFASCQVWEASLGHCGESGGLLYSGDHIQWWQLPHNQGQGHRYKLCWSVNDTGTTGVGVFVAKWWLGEAFEVQKVPDRIIIGKLIVGQCVVTALCMPHSGLVMRYHIRWWQLPHNQEQRHQVQALLVRKQQRHCWCRSVCGQRVDRLSF